MNPVAGTIDLTDLSDERLRQFLDWVYSPTLREQWAAFWRLYRILKRAEIASLPGETSVEQAVGAVLGQPYLGWFWQMRCIDDECEDRFALPMHMRLAFFRIRGYLMTAKKSVERKR